jgi:hypothetical protein
VNFTFRIGDILLETTDGRRLRFRRVARPNPEHKELLAGLSLTLPERPCADHELPERLCAHHELPEVQKRSLRPSV